MNLDNYFFSQECVIPKHVCNSIIDYALSKRQDIGVVGDGENNPKVRKSNLVWLDEPWVYNYLRPFVINYNEKFNLDFEINRIERVQFTIYSPGQHYDWHCDQFANELNPKYARKISMSLALNDATDYQGGQFLFDFRNKPNKENKLEMKTMRKAGSVVLFPSFVWHKVCPVTTGTRYSLVMWSGGPKFR